MVKYTIVELSKWNNLTLNAFNSINMFIVKPRGKMPVSVNILEINWVHVGRLTELLFFIFYFYLYVIQDKDLTLTVFVQIWY